MKGRWLVPVIAALTALTVPAQEAPNGEGAKVDFMQETLRTPPVTLEEDSDTTTLEIMVTRWGIPDRTYQRFKIRVEDQPSFVRRVNLSQTSMGFARDQWQRPVMVEIQVQPDALDGKGDLKIEIAARDEEVVPARRILVIPLRMGNEVENDREGWHEFVVRTLKDGVNPKDLENDERLGHIHDEEVPLFTVDPVALCFRDKLKGRKPCFYRIMDPDGKEYQITRVSGGEDAEIRGGGDPDAVQQVQDAPYEVVVWMESQFQRSRNSKGGRARLPGIYTVEVADASPRNGVYGLPAGYDVGEYRPIGRFELQAPTLAFKGVTTLAYPNQVSGGKFKAYMAFDPVVATATSGSLELTLEWTPPGKDMQTGASSLEYQFPDPLVLGGNNQSPTATLQIDPWRGNPRNWRVKAQPSSTNILGVRSETGPYHVLHDSSAHSAMGFVKWTPVIPVGKEETEQEEGVARAKRTFTFGAMHSSQEKWIKGLKDFDRSVGWLIRDPEVRFGVSFGFDPTAESFGFGSAHVVALYGASDVQVSEVELLDRSHVMDRRNGEGEDGEEKDPELAGNDQGGSDGGQGGSGTGSGAGTGSDQSAGNDTAVAGDTSGRGAESTTGSGGNSALDPNTLDPNRPDISVLIQEWRRIAEPPQNATEGASFRYNEWGVLEGQALSGTAVAGAKPDEVAGRSSSAYLWAIRQRLDSVDHCLLEEYVMAKLSGGSIDTCRGKYPRVPVVEAPRLVGRPVAAAKTELERLGLAPDLQVGDPAPDKDSEFMVQRQSVQPGHRMLAGKPVTVHLYSKFVSDARMPDLVGQPLADARKRLETLGLSPSFQVGTPAPSADRNSTVEAQEPAAGELVARGTKVTLVLHSNHVTASDIVGVQPSNESGSGDGGASGVGPDQQGNPMGPSKVARIDFLAASTYPRGGDDVSGAPANTRLGAAYSTPLKRGADHWSHPEGHRIRHARVEYGKAVDKYDRNAFHIEATVLWLEEGDPIGPTELEMLETLTQPTLPIHTELAPPTMRLGQGPVYIHHPERLLTVRLESTTFFEGLTLQSLERLAHAIFPSVAPHARMRDHGYTAFDHWKVPSQLDGIPLNIEFSRNVSGDNEILNLGQNFETLLPDVGYAYLFHRWSNLKFTKDYSSGGSSASAHISFYIKWLAPGDPYHPNMRQAFPSSGSVRRWKSREKHNVRNFIIHSPEIAANVMIEIFYYNVPKDLSRAEREAKAFAEKLFKQLEGHALKSKDIPTEPRMK